MVLFAPKWNLLLFGIMILGDVWENGLGLELGMGLLLLLKGEGEEGVEGVEQVFDEIPKQALAWLT